MGWPPVSVYIEDDRYQSAQCLLYVVRPERRRGIINSRAAIDVFRAVMIARLQVESCCIHLRPRAQAER